jgi:hypothetical protein
MVLWKSREYREIQEKRRSGPTPISSKKRNGKDARLKERQRSCRKNLNKSWT